MTTATASIELMQHQQHAVGTARERPRFAFFWEPGAGKTMAVLAIQQDRPAPTVIVCPKAIMRAAWEADAEKMGMPITILHGSVQTRSKLLDDLEAEFGKMTEVAEYDNPTNPPLIVTTFETFRRQDIRRDLIERMGVRRLIVDESSKIKNPKSQTTKAVLSFADSMAEVYLLSGTPAPNGPHEYWPQLRALDRRPGGLADAPWSNNPPNFWRWAQWYCIPQKKRIKDRDVITGWTLKDAKRSEFTDRLRACSEALAKEDCFDLPEASDQVIPVALTPSERRVYDDLLDRLAAEFDGETINIELTNQLMKLRQVAGGHLYQGGGVKQVGTSKLDTLGDLLESIGNEPVVVWAEFRSEIDAIAEAAGKLGRTAWVLDGRTKDAGRLCSRFQAGEADTLICHPAAVGHGVTLTRARYAVYYSLGFSYEQHQQSRDRIYRKGQERKVVYYYLLADDTVDHAAKKVLSRKKHESAAIMDVLREIAAHEYRS